MFTIGCHLSVTKGFYHMARTATELGANTFQFFPRNPRGGAAKPLAKEDIRQLEEWMDTHGFGEILCHGAYTMNGASTKEEVREFARTAIREDLAKVSLLPRCLYKFPSRRPSETGDGCCHSSHCGYGELCYGTGRPEYYRAF